MNLSPGTRQRVVRLLVHLFVATGIAGGATSVSAQIVSLPQEAPMSFDSRGRITVLFPRTATPIVRDTDWWPVKSNDWREAKLYSYNAPATDPSRTAPEGRLVAVIAVAGNDGGISRYGLTQDALDRLRTLFDGGTTPPSGGNTGIRSGVELSQPAGYTFVRNQTFLGLAAYGPATSAILSDNSASAAGGYLLAAGSSFFVAARMIRTRTVTRSQTILGTHGGLRGGAAGAAIAAIAEAHDGPGYGYPILLGAIGGTVGGFLAARNMSDGEAATSGLGADMFALTSLGVFSAADALEGVGNKSQLKVALGTTVGMAAAGYLIGPHYARRSAYNVTAGDASVALTGALIGATAGAAITDAGDHQESASAFATAGLLAGFFLSDRVLVRKYDRTSSDAGWAKLGAVAGALMGGGVAAIAETKSQGTLALISLGGTLGLVAADRMIAPARDAGPARGVMRTGALKLSPTFDERVQLSLPSAVTAFALWNQNKRKPGVPIRAPKLTGAIVNFPAVRVTF